jgi:hypothetical protein
MKVMIKCSTDKEKKDIMCFKCEKKGYIQKNCQVSNDRGKANQKTAKKAKKKRSSKGEENNNSKKKVEVQMCFICKEKSHIGKWEKKK